MKMTERQQLERMKELQKKYSKVNKIVQSESQESIDLKKRWMTYYRNNPEIYIQYRMGFKSFGFQNFSYHLMGTADQYMEVSTRGVGKSLRALVFASYSCLMYPNSKIGVTASTASQANENFLTAFMAEIIYKYSPFMHWLYEHGLIKTKETDKGYVAQFWNGSIIYFFPCINSSRGIHVNMLIGEELRLIKRKDWDSIAMPMLVPRRAGYRNREEYFDRIDLDENAKIICITSNRTKGEWFNTMFNDTFSNYFKNKKKNNKVFACDIFLALRHGLKKIEWFVQQQREMDELSFRMEILNETVGETEGAYFKWEHFRQNQVLKKPWYPLTNEDILSKKNKNRPKQDNEYRFIFIDFSWAGDNGGNKNDNTVIGCMSTFFKNGRLVRNIEYIETHSGSEASSIPLRVKELFWDYQSDYIVMDNRSGGEILFNQLSAMTPNPQRSEDVWNPHGFTVCIESELHSSTKSKIEELRNRTIDKDAIPCIIPIVASAELNSNMWLEMGSQLKQGNLRFLIDELEFKTKFEDSKEWFNLTSEEKADIIIPYTQTMLLINEAVNLSQEWRSGLLKLSEPTNGTKDRIVACAYANMIATKLEIKLAKNSQQDSEIDWDNFQLVY